MPRHTPRTPRRRAIVIALFERFDASGQTTVDRAENVIRNVKVCGLESDNKRRYPRGVLAAARQLYEGVTVYTDHPPKPGQTRGTREAFGVLRNVQDTPDGLRADLHYLPKHTLTEDVLSDVERRLGIFGLSHNVDARVEPRGGIDQVTEIVRVRSVDLVTDPATNRNLWESRRVRTLKQVIESSTLGKRARKALLEMGGAGGMLDQPCQEDDETDGRGHLANAVSALVRSSNGDDHDLAKKVMGLLKPAAPEPEEEGEDDDEAEGEQDDDNKEDMEEGVGDGSKNQAGQQRAMNWKDPEKKKGGGNWRHGSEEGRRHQKPQKGTRTVTEARVKALCELAGVEATQTVLEATKGVSEDSALAIIKLARGQGRASAGPRSSAPGTAPASKSVTESRQQESSDPDEARRQRAARLRGR